MYRNGQEKLVLFLQREVSELLYQAAQQNNCEYTSVCGVPYTALPLATVSTQWLLLTVHVSMWSTLHSSASRYSKYTVVTTDSTHQYVEYLTQRCLSLQ